jgi:hypothetical protein
MNNDLDLYRALYPRVSVDSLRSAVAHHTGLMDCYVACMDCYVAGVDSAHATYAAYAAYHKEARLAAEAELRKRGE